MCTAGTSEGHKGGFRGGLGFRGVGFIGVYRVCRGFGFRGVGFRGVGYTQALAVPEYLA